MDYQTSELELAAFLKARGHRLMDARPQGRLVQFAFPEAAAMDADRYFSGAEIAASELFEAHRHLRALIQQLKQHTNNRSGIYDYTFNRS